MPVRTRVLHRLALVRSLHLDSEQTPVGTSCRLALTWVDASTELAMTPEGAVIKLVINLPLQARLTCLRACIPPLLNLLAFPHSLTPGRVGPGSCHR